MHTDRSTIRALNLECVFMTMNAAAPNAAGRSVATEANNGSASNLFRLDHPVVSVKPSTTPHQNSPVCTISNLVARDEEYRNAPSGTPTTPKSPTKDATRPT